MNDIRFWKFATLASLAVSGLLFAALAQRGTNSAHKNFGTPITIQGMIPDGVTFFKGPYAHGEYDLVVRVYPECVETAKRITAQPKRDKRMSVTFE